jgi:hypothetical protein
MHWIKHIVVLSFGFNYLIVSFEMLGPFPFFCNARLKNLLWKIGERERFITCESREAKE